MSIDLDFRPASYSDFADPVSLALNGISGQMRREMVRDMMTAQGSQRDAYDQILGPIDPGILKAHADAQEIQTRNQLMGPSWMGGEYLPRLRPGEVEIARIVLQSVTMDVFSLRARWSGGRYHYRIVDEYESNFVLCQQTSRRTLTLGRVIDILETVEGDLDTGGCGMVECWWNQQWDYGSRDEDHVSFARVESELYPGLSAWYDQRAEQWRAEHPAEVELDDDW